MNPGVGAGLGAALLFGASTPLAKRLSDGIDPWMLAALLGAVVLSWPAQGGFAVSWSALVIVGACLAWAVDNNLTRKVSLADASWIAAVKGLGAGAVNLAIAFSLGASLPSGSYLAGALAVGFFAYGVGLALFVLALRYVGTARAGAYFSVAPFFGAAIAVPLLGEAVHRP